MLTDSQFSRYQRQVMLPEVGDMGQSKLLASKVLVIGCGGLGHSVATQLAASGVGHLVICDYDQIELSNLHRQITYTEQDIGEYKSVALKKAIHSLNSDVRVRSVNRKVDTLLLGLEIAQADLVVDCTDNFQIRHKINAVCVETNTPLVSGAAIGWDGQIVYFANDAHSSCYSCLYPDSKDAEAKNCSESGVLGPNVNAIAHLQALMSIRVLIEPQTLNSGVLTLFDGRAFKFTNFQIDKDNHCAICSTKESTYV
ncbi:HesA/MoeB/ThiF family protein [Vibrio gallicus]|uniref:HesA/MoeB/ThiF family protein n=1 Tax=Vibrio gallicus TaxID=190897 RepID=UPI0021C4AD8E|nr:HesA/MoeB/ThiF family protein [Vibrio gallicus]